MKVLLHLGKFRTQIIYSIRYPVQVSDGKYRVIANNPPGWFHTVLNFNGTDVGQGIKIFHNETEVGQDTELTRPYQRSDGSGRIAVGRRFSEFDENHASVEVNELLFFNEALSEEEIVMLAMYMT